MDSMIPEFTGFLSRQTLREPQIPLLSNVTGTWLAASEATNPATWARQVRSTVRFSDEVDVLLGDPNRVLIEVGPGGTLTASATRHPRWSAGHHAVRLMRHHAQNRDDRDAFLLALGQRWCAGAEVEWAPLRGGQSGRLLTLPGYPFERQRHWIEHRQTTWTGEPAATNGAALSTGGTEAAQATTSSKSTMEATLQRNWGHALGLPGAQRKPRTFEFGGQTRGAI